jgi:large subunit ribosomal protein L49
MRGFLTYLRHQAQALKEQPVTASAPVPQAQGKKAQPAVQLNNLPYFVRRTGSNQLPVYLVTKAGGTKQLTKIQKTEGDLDALRDDLAYTLGVDVRSPDVSINRLNGHIIVKVYPCHTRPLRNPHVVDIRLIRDRAGANPKS